MIVQLPCDELEAGGERRAPGDRSRRPDAPAGAAKRTGRTSAEPGGKPRQPAEPPEAVAEPARVNAGPRGPHRVAILVESSNAYGRGLLLGVHDHLAAAGDDRWITFLPEHGRGAPPLETLALWRGEGIIARIENDRIAAAVERLGVPAIDTSAGRLLPSLPFVETDDALISRLAASYFQGLGFHNVAFLGDSSFYWSRNRERHFVAEASARGMNLDVFESGAGRTATPVDHAEHLARWLRGLPKPVAVFASHDALGRRVLDACRWEHLRVPRDVAVLGVDNDELLCQLTSPPLSSIVPDARGAGRIAGEMLDRVLAGESVTMENLLPPLRVAVRESTDVIAIEDPAVAAAVAFIRKNAQRGIKVGDVVEASAVGRRSLEQRFAKHLGRSLHDEILRVQLHLVEEMLVGSDLKIVAVAHRAGFKHPEHMTAVFTQRYGLSPSEWRQANRPRQG